VQGRNGEGRGGVVALGQVEGDKPDTISSNCPFTLVEGLEGGWRRLVGKSRRIAFILKPGFGEKEACGLGETELLGIRE